MKWPDFQIGDALLVGGCGVVGLLWGLFATDNAFLHERAYPHLTIGGVIRAIVYWPFWLALGIQRLRGLQPYDDTRAVYVLGATAPPAALSRICTVLVRYQPVTLLPPTGSVICLALSQNGSDACSDAAKRSAGASRTSM